MGPRVPVAVTIAFAIMLHGGVAAAATAAMFMTELFAWNRSLREAVSAKLDQTYDIDVAKPQELPPEPPKEEPKDEPKPEPKPADNTPPPAPAQAGHVLAADPDPNSTVDMRDTIAQGDAVDFTGGLTSAIGTTKTPVYNIAAANTGTPGGTGTAPAPQAAKKEDKSRAAKLSGSTDWGDCPFPPEADADQIDDSYVTVQVKVKPDGTAESVAVTQDPGHGFGRAAKSCAMRKRYTNALDVDGNAIGGTTNQFRVHFSR
jgi:protein TonB